MGRVEDLGAGAAADRLWTEREGSGQVARVAGELEATRTRPSMLILWPVRTTLARMPVRGPSAMGPTAVWATTSNRVPIGTGPTVQLWRTADPSKPTLMASLPAGPGPVNRLQFSPDGNRLGGSNHDTVLLWDVTRPDQPAELATLAGRYSGNMATTFVWNGTTLASSDGPGHLRLWDVSTPAKPVALAELTESRDESVGEVTALVLRPGGHALASVDSAGNTLLWNITDPRRPNPVPIVLGRTNGVRAASFTPDGSLLATVDTNVVRLWDTANPIRPRALATVGSASSWSNAAAFSQDGRTLAETGFGTVRLWDVTNRRKPVELSAFGTPSQAMSSLAFGRDGRVLAVASDDTLRLWDLTNPRTPSVLVTRTIPNARLQAVAISPDSDVLVSSSNEAAKPRSRSLRPMTQLKAEYGSGTSVTLRHPQ